MCYAKNCKSHLWSVPTLSDWKKLNNNNNNYSILIGWNVSNSILQIDTLNENVKKAANFLARCPSCMKNFVQNLCDFTCSPQQSQFMEVKEVEKGDKGELSSFCRILSSSFFFLFVFYRRVLLLVARHATHEFINLWAKTFSNWLNE